MNFNKSAFEQALENINPAPLPEINFNIEEYEDEKILFEEISELRKNNWGEIRDISNFEVITREYSFGNRSCYKTSEKNNYLLQASRNPSYFTLEEMIRNSATCVSRLDDPDRVRISEASTVIEKVRENIVEFKAQAATEQERNALNLAFTEPNVGLVELGFKEPRLLGYYKNSQDLGFSKFIGYDISPLLVGIASKLGWDARTIDLNTAKEIDLQEANLVLAYHVLDRLSDPLSVLKMLKENCSPGTKFHFEVPTESGIPRLRYSKLSSFEKGDLQQMLIEAEFIPISFSNIPCPNGPDIERIMAISK